MSLRSAAALCVFDEEWPPRQSLPKATASLDPVVSPIRWPSWMPRALEVLRKQGPLGSRTIAIAMNQPGVVAAVITPYLDLAVGAGILNSADHEQLCKVVYSMKGKQ